jgi:hypothetical protein
VQRGHPPDVCEGNDAEPFDPSEVAATDETLDRLAEVDYTDPATDYALRLLAAYRAQHREQLLSDLMVNKVGGWDTPNGRNLLEAIRKRANFGSEGDFARCRAFLATKGVTGDKANRICASAHHEILGKWPAEGH